MNIAATLDWTSNPLLAVGPLGTRTLIGTLIIGLLAGVVAKFLTRDRDPMGCIVTMIVGVVGAFVATFLGRLVNFYGPEDTAGFIASVIGAIIVLAIYHLIIRRTGGGGGPTV
ncbi:MAG: GlsB/YeaQ/YmgE family stress response membrane protein [Verrucomicrobia bacterium]|nr:GlsB/YeaQ/YmgE family stress response membrane protein [Verrucomicrobiota bacterium]